jgi:hypothetical protein
LNNNLQTLTDKFICEFEASISAPRFKRYYRIYPVADPNNPAERDKLDAVAIYMWNVALCESLYPALQTFEVLFRNALNSELCNERGTSYWYLDSTTLLWPGEANGVAKALGDLELAKKPDDPARVVAELTFGFWVALYNDIYLKDIVHPTIQGVFPNLHPKQRNHRFVQKRLQQIRNLRNRVFHHEPIWHWRDLPEQHRQMLEAIGWISRSHAKLCIGMDRFFDVHAAGWDPFRQKLDWMHALEEEASQQQESTLTRNNLNFSVE